MGVGHHVTPKNSLVGDMSSSLLVIILCLFICQL